MSVPTVADERSHAPGQERFWNESWYLDWFEADGRTGGEVRVGLCPILGCAWFWWAVGGDGERPVLVVDQEVPMPEDVPFRWRRCWHEGRCVLATRAVSPDRGR